MNPGEKWWWCIRVFQRCRTTSACIYINIYTYTSIYIYLPYSYTHTYLYTIYIYIYKQRREEREKPGGKIEGREDLFKELAYLSVVARSPKSIGQVSKLEIQIRVDDTVLSPNSAGQAVPTGYSVRVFPLQFWGRIAVFLVIFSLCS